MKVYLNKEAYEILREIREELARKSGLDVRDVSFSAVVKYLHKKARTRPYETY